MLKKISVLLPLVFSFNAFAHCPAHFKEEASCFMLDQNTLYIYGEKKEHNGPYQDFKKSTLEMMSENNQGLKFSKVARGIYKIEADHNVQKLKLVLSNNKKKIEMEVGQEK